MIVVLVSLTTPSPRLRGIGCSVLTDPLEQHGGRLVVGVLGHQLSFKGAFEDGLPQPGGADEGGVYRLAQAVDDGESAVDLGDDAVLDFQDGQRNGSAPKVGPCDSGLSSGRLALGSDVLSTSTGVEYDFQVGGAGKCPIHTRTNQLVRMSDPSARLTNHPARADQLRVPVIPREKEIARFQQVISPSRPLPREVSNVRGINPEWTDSTDPKNWLSRNSDWLLRYPIPKAKQDISEKLCR